MYLCTCIILNIMQFVGSVVCMTSPQRARIEFTVMIKFTSMIYELLTDTLMDGVISILVGITSAERSRLERLLQQVYCESGRSSLLEKYNIGNYSDNNIGTYIKKLKLGMDFEIQG